MNKDDLSPSQKDILHNGATEPPGSGKLLHNKEEGSYNCAACGNILFTSDHKFDSGSGWPSFYDLANEQSVVLLEDDTLGTIRTEVKCSKCNGHLGHVFDDGYDQPTGKRYCINSGSLNFEGKNGETIQG